MLALNELVEKPPQIDYDEDCFVDPGDQGDVRPYAVLGVNGKARPRLSECLQV
jgi:hypothetical protein